MRFIFVMLTALTVSATSMAQDATGELSKLVAEYSRLEDAMDMRTQGNLISPDRVWNGIGGRRTDNAMWMQVQQENWDAFKARYPGVRMHREVRDLHIRMIGAAAAVTTFTWFTNVIIPGDLDAEKVEELGPGPVPQNMTLVWEKQGNSWKMIASHISPLFIRN